LVALLAPIGGDSDWHQSISSVSKSAAFYPNRPLPFFNPGASNADSLEALFSPNAHRYQLKVWGN